jgi:serine/threonine protein kinase
MQVASALDYLHVEKRYLHRDIKPDNLLLNAKGPVVCDFGSADAISVSEHTGPVRATAAYQPPEVFAQG